MDFTIRYNTEPVGPTQYRVEFTEPWYARAIGISCKYTSFTFSDIQAMADWVETWDNEPPMHGWTIKSIEKIGEPGH